MGVNAAQLKAGFVPESRITPGDDNNFSRQCHISILQRSFRPKPKHSPYGHNTAEGGTKLPRRQRDRGLWVECMHSQQAKTAKRLVEKFDTV